MDDEVIPPPPEGFLRSDNRGPFTTRNGPLFHKPPEDEVVHQAFYALPRHANGMGLVHGGMLTAFMDGLLAGAAFRGSGRSAVTIQLSVNFLHIAKPGDWVIGEARMTRETQEVAFVEGRAFVGSRDVVRASGVFKLMQKRPR